MKWFFILIAGLIILYRDSFLSRFFQDDFLLLKLSQQNNFFAPIANFPYRPVSIQIFYSIGRFLSGDNPAGFHLLSFLFLLGALFFIFKISKSKLATLFYAFNISLFPLFFWVATSYFVLAAYFTFGTIYFFLQKKPWSIFFFVLGLLSNELVLVLPALILLVDYRSWKRLAPFIAVETLYLFFRLQLGFPTASDYQLILSPTKFLATFRWYLLRIFNLPEGVRTGVSPIIYILFFLLVIIFVFVLLKSKLSWRLPAFAITWFFIGALPFFFLPNHMSSYYLTLSLFGPAVLVGKLFSKNKKLGVVFFIGYLVLAVFGLDYLSKTHWIILKPTL